MRVRRSRIRQAMSLRTQSSPSPPLLRARRARISAPARSVMNSRRFIRAPLRLERASSGEVRRQAAWRFWIDDYSNFCWEFAQPATRRLCTFHILFTYWQPIQCRIVLALRPLDHQPQHPSLTHTSSAVGSSYEILRSRAGKPRIPGSGRPPARAASRLVIAVHGAVELIELAPRTSGVECPISLPQPRSPRNILDLGRSRYRMPEDGHGGGPWDSCLSQGQRFPDDLNSHRGVYRTFGRPVAQDLLRALPPQDLTSDDNDVIVPGRVSGWPRCLLALPTEAIRQIELTSSPRKLRESIKFPVGNR